jgi:hypothetical protein
MGYLMRYITTDEHKITLPLIETALKQIDPAYAITNTEVDDLGDLVYGDMYCAIIEINHPGEEMFEDDLAEFKDIIGEGSSPKEQRVLQTLNNAKGLVVIEAYWQGSNSEATLARIDPLWNWLFANYAGISQADNEGFYDVGGLILERNFTL